MRHVGSHSGVGWVVTRRTNLQREVDDAVPVRRTAERYDVHFRAKELDQVMLSHAAACFDQHVRKLALDQPSRFVQCLHTCHSHMYVAEKQILTKT